MKYVMVGIMFAFASLPVQANVAIASLWKPQYTSEVFRSPAPPDVTAREEAFRNRNSGENIKQLADRFFGMIDLGLVPAAVKDKYLKADYQGALDAYRDFFIGRLRFPPPGYPYGYTFSAAAYDMMRPAVDPALTARRHLASADELMSNIVVFAMKDKDDKLVSVRLDIGPPGRVNWIWQPDGYVNAGRGAIPRKAGMVNCVMGAADFFNVLLVEYLRTGDSRYLKRWTEFIDDQCLNWRKNTIAAGCKVRINWNGVGANYVEGMWLNYAYLARTAPNFMQELSSPTLVRQVLDMFDTWAIALRGARPDMGNRRIGMYGNHLFWVALAFPEYRGSEYCLQEWRRLLENYISMVSRPDGTDPVEMARQYLCAFPLYAGSGWRLLNNRWLDIGTAPRWVTAEWTQEFLDYMEMRARYMIHHPNSAGQAPMVGDGYLTPPYAMCSDFYRVLLPLVPRVLAEPDCAKIITALYGGEWVLTSADSFQGQPSFSSEALPYSGFYALRTGYGKEEHYLFTYSAIAPWSAGDWWGSEASITLQAFGRDLLKSYSAPALSVDGTDCKVDVSEARRVAHPEVHLKWWAKINSKTAPLKHRWHTSSRFDVCETSYDFPFNNSDTNKPLRIEDVAHRRQVIFARQQGLYVVTDRMLSTNSHQYAIRWVFIPAVEKTPGWLLRGSYGYTNYGFKAEQINVDAARNAIRTVAPSMANLSIYHFSPQPLRVFMQDAFEGRCGLEGTGDQILTSVLYPRRAPEVDLGSIEALPADGGITGWKAVLPDGTRLSYRGAANEAVLALEDIEIKGEALLVLAPKEGKRSGIALGCVEFKVNGKKAAIPCADFEFDLSSSKPSAFSLLSSVISHQPSAISFTPIYRPLDLVDISPEADRFVDSLVVTMSHPEPEVDIRYTLDGTDPTGASGLYQGPITLNRTATVKARVFRKGVTRVPSDFSGTHVSAVTRAVYTREALWPAKRAAVTNGLVADYYEGDFTLSIVELDKLKPVKSTAVPGLFDLSMKQQTNGNYAFVYSGYLDVPRDGAYTFHAPREFVYPYLDSGYDLRVFVDGKEWYPATRLHNFGGWTVPLAKGLHTLKVYWVDQRPGQAQWAYPDWSGSAPSEGEENRSEKYMIWRGDKPTLEISGPGLDRQPVPDGMLYSARGSNLIVAWSNSRFTTSGVAADSNCVTDHVTGLMWLKNPDTTARTFTNAIAYCEGLAGTDGRGNYTDWRLPSRDELHSLVDARADDHPPLPPDHPFMDVQTGFYWAGPTGADSRDSAYKVNLYDGYVYDAGKEYLNYVWPVRGGQRK